MTNLNLEIPAEVREFAEKTVDQARKAFDSFVAAAQKASAQSEAAAETLTTNAKDLSAKAISFAESNVKAAFDLAEKLVQAKDPKEFLTIQSEFLKEQVATVTEQTKALGEAVKKAVVPTDSEIMASGPRKTKAVAETPVEAAVEAVKAASPAETVSDDGFRRRTGRQKRCRRGQEGPGGRPEGGRRNRRIAGELLHRGQQEPPGFLRQGDGSLPGQRRRFGALCAGPRRASAASAKPSPCRANICASNMRR